MEVDGFTGEYRMLRTDILRRRGRSVSPLIDRGQIEGGFVQGVGWLTLEELLWDARAAWPPTARPPTSCLRGRKCREDFTSTFLERAAEPGVVFGSKAVGEPPLMLAISVREAIRDAIAAFGTGGSCRARQPGHARARFLGHPAGTRGDSEIARRRTVGAVA